MPGFYGTATLDFGAAPGSDMASIAVHQAGMVSGALVEVWKFPDEDTDDHTIDEQLIENYEVMANEVIESVGFTIHGISKMHPCIGQFRVAWVWWKA